ncbi:hypothetical protein EYF10_002440 [Escherichia coli]|nr:hypothetical protein [Escherichia coli]
MKVDIDTSDKLYADAWLGFKGTDWKNEINVRDFIQHNYTPYEGDESFLAEATPATTELWEKVMEGIRIENATHAPVDFDTNIATTITAHDAGYINQPLEKIVGLQTDAPLKRALHPFGGINMIKSSFHAYGREMDSEFEYLFTDLRKTHNQGVFDVYSPDMLRCRKSGVLTGLPDGYGRGRIIGDYRRVALYGISYLVRERELQFADLQSRLEKGEDLEATIRLREELAEHRHALLQIQEMAAKYGFDISRPAQNAQEAVQWLYFAYLAAVKSQNGGAMSLGRTASFLDIYIERDFKAGVLNEQQAQELIDHFIMKIRMVRFLRTPEFDSLFSGDPIWATEVIGGMGLDGRTLVTKNSFRYLHTLHTMGPAPEPNLTILWSEELPIAFKKYAAQVSIVTSSLQYENDDLMRTDFNSDDYAIACCVSPMVIGKQMQFFGARANLAKTLLYAINGGVDEKLKIQVGPKTAPLMDDVLDYDKVMDSLDHFMDWLAVQYISALNIIHYMHDKYSYEASLMALHDRDVYRTMACGIAGLSVATDSLSAIKYARVKPIRDENGLAAGKVSVKIQEPCNEILFSRAKVWNGEKWACVTIVGGHTNIVHIETHNGVVFTQQACVAEGEQESPLTVLSRTTLAEILKFVNEVPFAAIRFILDSAKLNCALSQEGLSGKWGLHIGATLEKQCERGLLAKDLSSSIVIRTSAASDARMGGATLPAMSNSGSGNQGITATMPVVVVAEHFGADDERLARALMLSHLSAIYIHNQLPRLSALCAATTAAMGAAAGMAWLVDGRYETISMAISSMIGDVSGMICDGASNSCAMKVSTSASAAWKAVLMALDDTAVTGNEGIVAHDVEQSIANLCALASHSMQQTDRQIIEIMASKAR